METVIRVTLAIVGAYVLAQYAALPFKLLAGAIEGSIEHVGKIL